MWLYCMHILYIYHYKYLLQYCFPQVFNLLKISRNFTMRGWLELDKYHRMHNIRGEQIKIEIEYFKSTTLTKKSRRLDKTHQKLKTKDSYPCR